MENQAVLILYTTLYREGGVQFQQAAKLMAEEKQKEFPQLTVIVQAIETKQAFKESFAQVEKQNKKILEFHFIGHSGMYGIMFGTTAWPEQMSPYEWSQLQIPFALEAKAYFHACRTGRWFAPFFARTFNVTAFGYFWYTTISRSKNRFQWDAISRPDQPIYVISTLGKKSHGVFGTIKKHLLRPEVFPMLEFKPTKEKIDTTYDSVAALYDDTFEDISVRRDELNFLRRHLQTLPSPRLLDIGCGTGSFLRGISDLVSDAHGVDLSAGMIAHAKNRSLRDSHLSFSKIDGPQLPFPDNSFDVVTSVLSFRYLDWDPIIEEILRVLKPGGKIMVIDMVAAPVKVAEVPFFLRDKLKQQITEIKNPEYRQNLQRMVRDPRWKQMLTYNPIRAEHEMKWYLSSRFPGGDLKVINYAWNSRMLAFTSPPLYNKTVPRMSYP